MPIENNPLFSIIGQINSAFVVKIFLILFLIFYNFFAFVMYRQIQLMCRTLPTPVSGVLKFVAIVHIGVSLAVLLAVIGIF